MIIDVLIDRIKALASPVCVGLDPRPELVPEVIVNASIGQYGKTPEAMAAAFIAFGKGIIDCVGDVVPCVKPQIAMYERYGVPGLGAYAETVRYAKSKGLIVIGDVKRGDIASTAAAYADAHLGTVDIGGISFAPFDTDFVTINPYLGRDAVEPFFGHCRTYEKGLFILVKTSNPGGCDFQDLILADGKPLYEHAGELVSRWGQEFVGKHGYSSVGAVVGANYPAQGARLRELMPRTFFLIPGYGAQGGTAKDAAACFDKDGLGGVVNASRSIIGAWKEPLYAASFNGGAETWFGLAAREEALKMKEELNKCI